MGLAHDEAQAEVRVRPVGEAEAFVGAVVHGPVPSLVVWYVELVKGLSLETGKVQPLQANLSRGGDRFGRAKAVFFVKHETETVREHTWR